LHFATETIQPSVVFRTLQPRKSELRILSVNFGVEADFGKNVFSKRGLDHLAPLVPFKMDLLFEALGNTVAPLRTIQSIANSPVPQPSAVANANIQMPSFPEILVHTSSAHSREMEQLQNQLFPRLLNQRHPQIKGRLILRYNTPHDYHQYRVRPRKPDGF
jgi:hypothetical protein